MRLQSKWSDTSEDEAIIWWKQTVKIIQKGKANYKLYYIKIPYKHYWREVNSVDIFSDVNEYTMKNLDPKSAYRFTILNIRGQQATMPTSNAYITPREPGVSRNKDLVPAPANARCSTESDDQIKVNWDAVEKLYNISGYQVNIFSDLDGRVVAYKTQETWIILSNLRKGIFWYGIQITAYGNNDFYSYEKTPFISCRVKTKSK